MEMRRRPKSELRTKRLEAGLPKAMATMLAILGIEMANPQTAVAQEVPTETEQLTNNGLQLFHDVVQVKVDTLPNEEQRREIRAMLENAAQAIKNDLAAYPDRHYLMLVTGNATDFALTSDPFASNYKPGQRGRENAPHNPSLTLDRSAVGQYIAESVLKGNELGTDTVQIIPLQSERPGIADLREDNQTQGLGSGNRGVEVTVLRLASLNEDQLKDLGDQITNLGDQITTINNILGGMQDDANTPSLEGTQWGKLAVVVGARAELLGSLDHEKAAEALRDVREGRGALVVKLEARPEGKDGKPSRLEAEGGLLLTTGPSVEGWESVPNFGENGGTRMIGAEGGLDVALGADRNGVDLGVTGTWTGVTDVANTKSPWQTWGLGVEAEIPLYHTETGALNLVVFGGAGEGVPDASKPRYPMLEGSIGLTWHFGDGEKKDKDTE